jgi:threonine dehydrogenase-like Zn-dependent dehydrogenase
VPADIIAIIVFFAISGIVGAGVIGLLAYKMRLASKLEWARVHAAEDVPEQTLEQIQDLQEQVERLTERVDFTEKLLDAGPEGVGKLSERSVERE